MIGELMEDHVLVINEVSRGASALILGSVLYCDLISMLTCSYTMNIYHIDIHNLHYGSNVISHLFSRVKAAYKLSVMF